MFFSWLFCHEALARLDDFLDRELAPDEVRLVETHLKICAHCTHKFNFERGFRRGLREKIAHLQAPADLLDEILNQLPPDFQNSASKNRK